MVQDIKKSRKNNSKAGLVQRISYNRGKADLRFSTEGR